MLHTTKSNVCQNNFLTAAADTTFSRQTRAPTASSASQTSCRAYRKSQPLSRLVCVLGGVLLEFSVYELS